MSKPVDYTIIIRDGHKQRYEDLWVDLTSQLLWGPEEFESWLREGEEIDWEAEELSSLALVNFDTQELSIGESDNGQEVFAIPRVLKVRQQMLQQAWPGFDINTLTENEMYNAVWDRGGEDPDHDDDKHRDRYKTVREAAGYWDDEETDDEDVEDRYEDDDETPRAWVTVIDDEGKTRQRIVATISEDLLSFNESAIQQLAELKAADIPPEKVVQEGLWIDQRNKRIGFWGGLKAARDFPRLQQGWPDWHVQWAENGYVDQCAVNDVPGIPMSDAEAVAKFMPSVLSTERFNLGNVFGAMGGSLKKRAAQAVGCLLFVIAIPILSVGYLMDRFKESGYIVIGIVVVVAILFKVIETKIKAKFSALSRDEDDDDTESRPAAAGPLDEKERRRRIDQMLAACGFPPLAELEPHFPEKLSLDDVM